MKKQGYSDHMDESMGAKNPGKKKQSYKSRRDESKGMGRKMARKAGTASHRYGKK